IERQELVARAPRVMGHDGVARVDGAHELRDHAVRADRHLVRAELPAPLREPRRPRALELRPDALAARPPPAQALYRLDELAQHPARVAKERVVRGVALVQIALVVGGVDQRLARRDARGHRMAGEAAADSEHEVGLAQVLEDRPAYHDATGAEGQRMILG